MGTAQTALRSAARKDNSHLWSPEQDQVVRVGVENHVSNRVLAAMLNKVEEQVKLRVISLELRKPKGHNRQLSQEPRHDIPAKVLNELMQWVDKLGQKRVLDMPQLSARKAFDFLHIHRDKLNHVPGATRLYERLSPQYK